MKIETSHSERSGLSDYSIDDNLADISPNVPPSKSLEIFWSKMEMLSSCASFLRKMPFKDRFEFALDSTLIKKCEELVKWKSNLFHTLHGATYEYSNRKIKILDQCLAVLRTEHFLKKQLELLKQGNPSLFSSSNSESKRFFLQFPRHDGNSSTTEWRFQDLTNNKLITLSSDSFDISEENAYRMCDGQTSDQIFGQLANTIAQQFGSLSLDNATSLSELRSILDAMEGQRESVEEVLKGAENFRFEALNAMINTQKKIENNISTMFENVCSVVENPSDHSFTIKDCQVPPAENSNYLIYLLGLGILALSGLYFLSRSKQVKIAAASNGNVSVDHAKIRNQEFKKAVQETKRKAKQYAWN